MPPLTEDAIYEWEPVAEFYRKQELVGRFPLVCQLAKKVLSAPASSVYSERLFSEMGNLYEKKRSWLRPYAAENLLFLHHNMARNYQYKLGQQKREKLQKLRNRNAEEEDADAYA